MSPSPPEPLTAEDARILALEHGNIRGHTCKIVVVEGRRSVDEVRAHVAGRVHLAPPLLRRLAPEPRDGPPAWVDDETSTCRSTCARGPATVQFGRAS